MNKASDLNPCPRAECCPANSSVIKGGNSGQSRQFWQILPLKALERATTRHNLAKLARFSHVFLTVLAGSVRYISGIFGPTRNSYPYTRSISTGTQIRPVTRRLVYKW
jgi:hypothetical protein